MKLLAALAITALSLAPVQGWAQANWPSSPIKIVMPYPPSTSGDLILRKLTPLVSQELGGANIIIENRPGANGNIGVGAVANAAPDGYTFLAASDIQFAVAPALYQKLPFDADKSFVTVGTMARNELSVIANPSLGVKNMQELVALAKSKPGQISYGSTGIGSTHQLFMELVKMQAGIDMVHIPYKGSGQAIPDLMAGQIQVMFSGITQVLPHLASGKLVALAVGSMERQPQLPNVPTLNESGFPKFEAFNYWAIWAPTGTPQPIVEKMRAALAKAVEAPVIKEWFLQSALAKVEGGPEALDKMVKADRAKWAEVIKANKIEVNE